MEPLSPRDDLARLRGPLNNLIAARMQALGLPTVKQFADYAEVGRTSIYELVRGRTTTNRAWTNPSIDTLIKLAVALDVPTHELLYLIDPSAPGADLVTGKHLPLYVAGRVDTGPEHLAPSGEVVYVEQAFMVNRELMAFRVYEDSMAGGKHPIYQGDVVIVDRLLPGELNFPVVARLREGGFVVKRLRPGGILDSANPEADPQQALIAPDQVAHVLGRVVRVISNVLTP